MVHIPMHDVVWQADDPQENILRSQFQIGDQDFHVLAMAVTRNDENTSTPVNEDYNDELDAVASLVGGEPGSVTIKDREYVLTIFPHSY